MNARSAILALFVVLTIVFASTTVYEAGIRTATTYTTTSVTVSTTSIVPSAYDQVAASYEDHLLEVAAANASSLLRGYQEGATVQWTGVSGGCDGTYTGLENISRLLTGFLSPADYFHVSNETQTIGAGANGWTVNSTFDFSANSAVLGNFTGTVAAQDAYARVGGGWLISHETWNFVYLDATFNDGPPVSEC